MRISKIGSRIVKDLGRNERIINRWFIVYLK